MFFRKLLQHLPCGVILVMALSFVSCSRQAQPRFDRVAVIPFEYQGSDANQRWLGLAVGVAVFEQMRGGGRSAVFLAGDSNAAAQRQAARVVRGTVSGSPDAARFRLYLENVGTGELRSIGDDRLRPLGQLLPALRAQLESAGLFATPLSTGNADAFANYGRAVASQDPGEAAPLLSNAVQQDPTFSSASLRLASLLAGVGRREEAIAEMERLLAALPAERELERSYAFLELASLRNDAEGIEKALEQVLAAAPGDIDAATRLGSLYQQRRRYADAAKVLRGVAELEPGNTAVLNQIVYSESFGGRKAEAMEALGRYRDAAPGDANVDDTAGDIYFFFGDFEAAAASYRKAAERNPQFLNGYSLFKAAWALLLGGQFETADNAANEYVGSLRTSNAPLADLRSAQWQFLRGRREEARSGLLALLNQKQRYPSPFLGVVASQLYLWDIAEGGFKDVLRDFTAGKARYGSSVVPALGAILRAAQPSITPAERAAAIAPLAAGNQQALLVAVSVYLGASATGDLSPEDLQGLAFADQQTPESAAIVTHALLGWGYLRRGEPKEAAAMFSRRVPPTADDDGLLWPLVFPASVAWELEAWRQLEQAPPVPSIRRVAEELLPAAAAAN